VARHLRGDPPPQAQAFSPQQRDRSIESRGRITVDVLYGDHEGGQPAVTRFVLLPEADAWRCDAVRHWSLPASKELRGFGFN
jgi:hypothetical protein